MPTIKLLKPRRNSVPTVRQSKYQDIYQDKRWKKQRKAKMIDCSVCERCSAQGKTTPTADIHHAIPFDWGRTEEEIEYLAFDYNNLLSLCDKCHDEIHIAMEKGETKRMFLMTPIYKI